MARLTKQQVKLHQEACALAALDRDLDEEEREFVLQSWNEAADASASINGSFFTPLGLAFDLRFHVYGDRIIDLCAGIGRLGWGCRELWTRRWENKPPQELICVEKNPTYVAVGRKVLPEATWITADIFDHRALAKLGRFSTAICNPPFGRASRSGKGPRYRGQKFEYHAIDVAADLAEHGAFIVPQTSAPFRYSGEPCFREVRNSDYERFTTETGIHLEPNLGIDTHFYVSEWRYTAPRTEVVTCDFTEHPALPRAVTTLAAPRTRRGDHGQDGEGLRAA